MFLTLFSFCLAGCGGTNSGDGISGDTTYEEQTDGSTQEGGTSARLEMDEYEFHMDAAEDTTLSRVINHSYGQDIIALTDDGEEITRITLEGKDGGEEYFRIIIPASALNNGHNRIKVKDTELSDKVLETNPKVVFVDIGDTK